MIDYFSDRENWPVARTEEVINPVVRAAIVATVQGLINSGAFGQRFPERMGTGWTSSGATTVGNCSAANWNVMSSWPSNARRLTRRQSNE